jgi:hypothetical protein
MAVGFLLGLPGRVEFPSAARVVAVTSEPFIAAFVLRLFLDGHFLDGPGARPFEDSCPCFPREETYGLVDSCFVERRIESGRGLEQGL